MTVCDMCSMVTTKEKIEGKRLCGACQDLLKIFATKKDEKWEDTKNGNKR